MSRHTPFIVVSVGLINPDGYLYKLKTGENPVYEKYATGTASDMIELANELNYREAEKHSELAVAEAPREEEPVGIPTEDTVSVAERTLRRIRTHIEDADRGKLNLVDVKNHIHNELVLWSESVVR